MLWGHVLQAAQAEMLAKQASVLVALAMAVISGLVASLLSLLADGFDPAGSRAAYAFAGLGAVMGGFAVSAAAGALPAQAQPAGTAFGGRPPDVGVIYQAEPPEPEPIRRAPSARPGNLPCASDVRFPVYIPQG
jgi:hypothetical protein